MNALIALIASCAVVFLGAAAAPSVAFAGDAPSSSPPATAERPMLDPWLPPAARKPSTTAPTEGAALRAQVELKLRQSFDAADVNRSGTLTRAQASAAGLGYITQHFDEIDRQHAGVIQFDDVKRFLQSQGAKFN